MKPLRECLPLIPTGPLLTVLVCGGAFLLLENEPKLVLLLMLLLLGLLGMLGCARLGVLRQVLLFGLGFSAIINPRKYFGITDASELLGGAAGYLFITLFDAIAFCLFVSCAGRIPAALRRQGGLPGIVRLCLAGFLVLTGVSFLNAGHLDHAFAQLVFEFKCLMLFLTIFAIMTDRAGGGMRIAVCPLLYGLCCGMGVEACVAAAEYLRIIGSGVNFLGIMVGSFSETLESGIQAFRVGGTYQHPNYLAMPAAALLLFFWQVQMDNLHAIRANWLLWGGLMASLICVVLPFSRGGWFGMLCGGAVYMGVMLGARGRAWFAGLPWRYIGALCLAALCVGLGFFDQIYDKIFHSSPQNLLSRYDLNTMAMEMIIDHPWLGVGAGNHSYGAEGYGRYAELAAVAGLPPMVHNIYLLIASDIGLPGALCFFVLPLAVMAYGIRSCLRYPNHPLVALVCACVSTIAVFLAGDAFGAGLRKVDVAYMYWLLLALGMSGAATIWQDGLERA